MTVRNFFEAKTKHVPQVTSKTRLNHIKDLLRK